MFFIVRTEVGFVVFCWRFFEFDDLEVTSASYRNGLGRIRY